MKVHECIYGVAYSCDAVDEFWCDDTMGERRFFWLTGKGEILEFFPALNMEVDEAYAVQMWN